MKRNCRSRRSETIVNRKKAKGRRRGQRKEEDKHEERKRDNEKYKLENGRRKEDMFL